MKTLRFVATVGTLGFFAAFAHATEFAADNPLSSSAAPVDRPNATVPVTVFRASDSIGTDVISSDRQKVGDVVDFVFDATPPGRVAYVIIMTGGLLELRGETRAVPATAITFRDVRAHIPLTKAQFFAVPAIKGGRETFLSNEQNTARIAQAFNTPLDEAPRPNDRLLSFNAMLRDNIYSQTNGRIGYVRDAWITLTPERVPYIDMNPMFNPFEISSEDFAIPLSRLQSADSAGYTFDVKIADLTTAPLMTGNQFADSRQPTNGIVRMTPQEAIATKEISPTGPATPPVSASPRAITAAQAVRGAFDGDPNLRQLNVQVMARGDSVVLRGSVPDTATRNRIDSAAATAAGPVAVTDELTAPTP